MNPAQPRPCANRHPQLAADDACAFCRMARHDERYRNWRPTGFVGPATSAVTAGDEQARRDAIRRLKHPCRHLGEKLPGQPCGSQFRRCNLYGDITATASPCKDAARCCATCPSHPVALEAARNPPATPGAAFPVRFDENNLAPGVPGKRFNPSLIDWEDGYLLAFRNGWCGSEIYLVRLDRDFKPAGDAVKLDLFHAQANYGREDPRLFRFNGKLHVAYIGVHGYSQIVRTNQLYARISDDLKVEQVFFPRLEGRNAWEKNWQFFEHDGALYAVYSIAPHRVLRVDGERAEWAFDTPTPAPWGPGTEMRGGASPVRVGDEWWGFFHSRVETNGHRRYLTGLYTFDAEPPFRVRRVIPEPILWADRRTNPGNYASVVFAGGAVRVGNSWVVAHGIHDRWSELHAFDVDELESKLVPLQPPAGWAWRDNGSDAGMYRTAVYEDEYRVPDLAGGVALDVGGHIGAFADRALRAGASAVHCYEPYTENVAILQRNAATLGERVTVFAEAVGAPGVATLYYHPHADDPAKPDVGFCDENPSPLPVPAVGLDEAIARAAAASANGRVAFLKIDCEGCEYPAILGARRLDLVDRVAGEWHGRDPGELLAALRRAGFVVESTQARPGLGLFFAWRPVTIEQG